MRRRTARKKTNQRLSLASVGGRSPTRRTSGWVVLVLGGLVLVNHANVFSREKLDIGTRFLLDHLPAVEGPAHVVDLGCGNGVVGLAIAATAPEAHVTFVDESFMAVASAAATCAATPGEDRAAPPPRLALRPTPAPPPPAASPLRPPLSLAAAVSRGASASLRVARS